MGPEHYFFELPIYRCSERPFYSKYARDLEAHLAALWPPNTPPNILAELRPLAEDHFRKRYGGPWHFNQTVGWIRLYTLGTQIRGELWLTSEKSLVRRPQHKRIEKIGKVFEYHPDSNDSSAEIAKKTRKELVEAVKSIRNGRLILNLECFDNLAGHIDWGALIAIKNT